MGHDSSYPVAETECGDSQNPLCQRHRRGQRYSVKKLIVYCISILLFVILVRFLIMMNDGLEMLAESFIFL